MKQKVPSFQDKAGTKAYLEIGNHCRQTLILIGEDSRVKEITNLIASEKEGEENIFFDFNKVIPFPEGLKFGSKEGCEWCLNNWDNSGNAFHQSKDDDNIITFTADKEIPYKVLKKLSLMYPDVTFEIAYVSSTVGETIKGEYQIKLANVY